jgi:hypothetical protein
MTNLKVKNIVLVHGGFVDGSGWQGVYAILKDKGFKVSIVQNPTISLADDVAATNRVIEAQDGPSFLLAIPTEAPSSLRQATIPRWSGLPTLLPLHWITASRLVR